MGKVSLDDLKSKPPMTGWFDPRLLSRLLLNVIVSGTFGKYADRRLIHAALDQVDEKEFLRRADLRKSLKQDPEGAVWIDYVADLGDGFEATYALAYLLAQESLDVGKYHLPRGQALIMGGDQVYPDASRKDYRDRMRTPYEWAFPDNLTPNAPHPPVFMIPGNPKAVGQNASRVAPRDYNSKAVVRFIRTVGSNPTLSANNSISSNS